MQRFDAASLADEDFEKILSFLRAGGVIAFPTDTAYGLGADPWNLSALRHIFQIKGRPEARPILLLVNSLEMVERVATLTSRASILAERFWPGPLTLVLPASGGLPDLLTAGTRTIGVRWAQAEFANRLIEGWNRPVTATSANHTGNPAAVTAEDVETQLGAGLEMLVDGGQLPTQGGSTVLDLIADPPVVLRQGPVTADDLRIALREDIRTREGSLS